MICVIFGHFHMTATCEHRDDDVPCGQPAPHVSLDRRTPLCDGHRETAPIGEMSA